MKEITLPSGAILKVGLSPFKDSRALYQALLEEAKGLSLDPEAEVDVNLYKDIMCFALASKKIESALWECMKRCQINDLKIDDQTFEPADRRDDYLTTMLEVAKENVLPFTKSLSAALSPILEKLQKNPA